MWLVGRPGAAAGGDGSGSTDAEVVTAPVERRPLEALQVARGTVISPAEATVVAPAPGPGHFAVVVTRLPHPQGDAIAAGAVVAELNGRPVLAVPGAIPFFRDILPGDAGPDVAAVQAALEAMGHVVPAGENGAFGPATAAAVAEVYAAAGYAPPAAGLPAHEVAAVPRLPAVLVDLPLVVGQAVPVGAPVAVIGSPGYKVRVDLTGAQARELTTDVEVAVQADQGYAATCPPAEAAPVAAAPVGDAEDGAGVPADAWQMTVTCDPAPPAETLSASVRVTLTVRRSEGPVLVVPATAMATAADGRTHVEVVEGGHSRRVEVAVGGEAGGFVAVDPLVDDGLAEGDEVRVRRS
jgi:peptidoglycan hydrolase-like protein with peptidoglycan-binding domain